MAAVIGALAVVAGAFGAHALRDHLSPDHLKTWDTAARYHLLHAAVLLVAADRRWAWRLFVAGIVLFSGSLYLLVLLDLPALGAVTPFGGLAFISGWLALGWERRADNGAG